MEPVTMFFTRRDFAGVASTRVHRPAKQFEAALDRLFGERVRDDGALGVDLWCALAGIECRNGQGETVCYSHRCAGEVVTWVRETEAISNGMPAVRRERSLTGSVMRCVTRAGNGPQWSVRLGRT